MNTHIFTKIMLKVWTSDFFHCKKSIETYFSVVARMYIGSGIKFWLNYTFLTKVSVFKDKFKFRYYKNIKYQEEYYSICRIWNITNSIYRMAMLSLLKQFWHLCDFLASFKTKHCLISCINNAYLQFWIYSSKWASCWPCF